MSGSPSNPEKNPQFWRTVKSDFREGGHFRTLARDFKDIREFYLDDERKARLARMGSLKRWFVQAWWLLKMMFFRLSSTRRLLLLLGIILILTRVSTNNSNSDSPVLGLLMLLFVLMLELKDKLLARDELAEGRAIQYALMPETSPKVPGWELWLYTRPANDVGGDLLDFLPISPQRFGIAIGDVMGKGLGAALFMAKLQATLRALAADFESLAALGEKINRIFQRDGLPNRFASLSYLEIAPGNGRVRILNAGHLPAIAIHNDGIEEMPKGGMALGLSARARYGEQQIDLAPGDLLLIYSDGLTEACDESGRFFDDERLLALLPQFSGRPAAETGQKLLETVNRFIGEARPHDDLTLAVLRRMEKT